MKLHILGCNGPYPAPGAACSGYLAEGTGGVLAIDMGCGVLPRLLQIVDPERLSALILSHLHADHISDALVLRYLLQKRNARPLPVYAPCEPAAMRALFDAPVFELHTLSDGMCAHAGSFSLEFLRVNHPIECYAVRVSENGKALVYSGDTNICPALTSFAKNADLFLCDGGIAEAEWSPNLPHLSPKRAAGIANDARVGCFVVTHISPEASPADVLSEAKSEYDGTLVAEAGAVYEF